MNIMYYVLSAVLMGICFCVGVLTEKHFADKEIEDKRHYHYVCKHCKSVSKYRKTPYCPMCGYLMLNSEMKPL